MKYFFEITKKYQKIGEYLTKSITLPFPFNVFLYLNLNFNKKLLKNDFNL